MGVKRRADSERPLSQAQQVRAATAPHSSGVAQTVQPPPFVTFGSSQNQREKGAAPAAAPFKHFLLIGIPKTQTL